MPHYYFHLRTMEGTERDDEGMAFPSLGEARKDALACLLEMASDELSHGRHVNMLGIDITDGQRIVLAAVNLRDLDPDQSGQEAQPQDHGVSPGRGGEGKT